MDKTKFTPELISELKGFYVERVVDNMDTKDLVRYVMDDLDRYYENQSDEDFLEDAYNYWEDHFDDVVEEISEYMNCKFKKDRKNDPTYFDYLDHLREE
tara:strand:+ start:470 stop:766 length:297 start_codon:yes stop_codon:yes gene_type:complete